MKHELIDVMNRRWCVGCDLFQSKQPNEAWRDPKTLCPRSTPYAISIDRPQEKEFVDEIKRADAQPPEASFDNAKDMLGYLNGDTACAGAGTEPVAWADREGIERPMDAHVKKMLQQQSSTSIYWERFSVPLYAAPQQLPGREGLCPTTPSCPKSPTVAQKVRRRFRQDGVSFFQRCGLKWFHAFIVSAIVLAMPSKSGAEPFSLYQIATNPPFLTELSSVPFCVGEFDFIGLEVFADGNFSVSHKNKSPLSADQSLASQASLTSPDPNQKSGEKSENDSEDRDDGIGDLALAYKFLAPFGIFIGALACTIIGYEMQSRKDSLVGTVLGFGGPLGLLVGLWWWVL